MTRLSTLLLLWLAACSGKDGSTDGKTDSTSPIQTGTPPTDLPKIWINEFQPSNMTTLQDEVGMYPDWIELYNPNAEDVDLGGWWLTDDTTDVFKWRIPDGVSIDAEGYLVVFADSDPEEGDLHASFQLDAAGGEDIGLYGPNVLDNPLVDSVEDYQVMVTDFSLARTPDGGSSWDVDDTPTPGAAND